MYYWTKEQLMIKPRKGKGFKREDLVALIITGQLENKELEEKVANFQRLYSEASRRQRISDDFSQATATAFDAMAHTITALQPMIRKIVGT